MKIFFFQNQWLVLDGLTSLWPYHNIYSSAFKNSLGHVSSSFFPLRESKSLQSSKYMLITHAIKHLSACTHKIELRLKMTSTEFRYEFVYHMANNNPSWIQKVCVFEIPEKNLLSLHSTYNVYLLYKTTHESIWRCSEQLCHKRVFLNSI